jgi:hypothetical protein
MKERKRNMNNRIRKYLFAKGIFVSENREQNAEWAAAAAFALADEFAIRLTKGAELADEKMIALAASELGRNVPEPFYRGFPESVRALTKRKLAFDQLLHYVRTYGIGDFSEAGHSLFEENLEKTAFQGKSEWKDFIAVTEAEGVRIAEDFALELLDATRPLSDWQYEFLKQVISAYSLPIQACACKTTAARLLSDTRDLRFARYLSLSDTLKVVEWIVEKEYCNYYQSCDLKKLNLRNQDRKFIAAVIDEFFKIGVVNERTCHEKRAIWRGLLHHIHYRAKSARAQEFVDGIRGKDNLSVYADFERAIAKERADEAAKILKDAKGSAAVLRNLNYLISRAKNEEEIVKILSQTQSNNRAVLLQLYLQYSFYGGAEKRFFRFTRRNELVVHEESEKEQAKRKSVLSKEQVSRLQGLIYEALKNACKGQLGKVYIDDGMKKIAVPIQENTAQGGYAVLPKGSRLKIEEGKIVRAFTYWEKVNDIDLGAIGITESGKQVQFSWRCFGINSTAITYSGDQTSGYKGGSEYFDINYDAFCKKYPKIKYLIFCNNVFSATPFSQCTCKAGYMIRDVKDGGKAFEAKTVKTAFAINCNSTFAYLFAIDLTARELVWLNIGRESFEQVAGNTDFKFLEQYFNLLSVMNAYELFKMLASEVVETPDEAEIIVSDRAEDALEGKTVVRSLDTEALQRFL